MVIMIIEIKTSLSNAMRLNLASSVFAGFVFAAFFYFADYSNLKRSIFLGFAVSLIGVAYCVIRFLFASPRIFFISDEELRIVKRNGKADNIVWSSVIEATHSTFIGMKWSLYLNERTVTIHNDGFALDEWNVLSKSICRSLESRHIPIKTDLIGKASVKMD